jgi:signal transduction histidine kinase
MLDRIAGHVARQRQFVSDASHELRTPLTAIRGQAEVLERDPDPNPEKVRATTTQIARQVGRMDRLVEDMLLMARTDEDGPARLEGVDLRALAEEAVAALEPGDARRVQVEALPAGVVQGDHDQLLRAVANVVQNAVQHTQPEGRVDLTGSARRGVARLVVDDDGDGIAPAERELVFERFHRSDASRDRRAGGSGLGLPIAKSIVTAHGGSIWADASPLGGARIVIELPGFEEARPLRA